MSRRNASSRNLRFPTGYVGKELLGSGSESDVWLAEDTLMKRAVTLKHLRTGTFHQDITTLTATLALAASVEHPNVSRAITAIPDSTGIWVVGTYVDGIDLASLIDGEPLDDEAIFAVVRDICEGVDALSRAEVCHQDLAPKNIIVGPSGVSKITDFGLACRLGDPASSGGTPGYIPPERRRGVAAKSSMDIFSVGAIIVRLLTGHPPKIVSDAAGNRLVSMDSLAESTPFREALLVLGRRMADPDPAARPGTMTVLHEISKLQGLYQLGRSEYLSAQVQRQMTERRANMAAKSSLDDDKSLWDRWRLFALMACVFLLAAILVTRFLLDPPLPTLEHAIITTGLDPQLPAFLTPSWVDGQAQAAIEARWMGWDLLSEEVLRFDVVCGVNLCQITLYHDQGEASYVHTNVLSDAVYSDVQQWRGVVHDLVTLAAGH